MAMTAQVKDELARLTVTKPCCRKAEVSLTLLRKARGAEKHEGNTVFAAGSQGDRCLLSWLEGSVDQAACSEVATPPVSPFAE
jgi:hypothetical protein